MTMGGPVKFGKKHIAFFFFFFLFHFILFHFISFYFILYIASQLGVILDPLTSQQLEDILEYH